MFTLRCIMQPPGSMRSGCSSSATSKAGWGDAGDGAFLGADAKAPSEEGEVPRPRARHQERGGAAREGSLPNRRDRTEPAAGTCGVTTRRQSRGLSKPFRLKAEGLKPK